MKVFISIATVFLTLARPVSAQQVKTIEILRLSPTAFARDFAANVPRELADFIAFSQITIASAALSTPARF